MSALDELQTLLPTRATKWIAGLTISLLPLAFVAPHFLSPLWTKSTETEIVLAQILAPTLIALIGALIVLVQVVNTDQDKQRRRELIAAWRKMTHDVLATDGNEDQPIAYALERHECFSSLHPHLTHETIEAIYANRTMLVASAIPYPITRIREDIASLEKKWRLI